MKLGKKRHRSAYTSKGQRANVSRETVKLAAAGVSEYDKALNKVRAWRSGKNPWVNVNGIKIKSNILWGDPKGRRTSGEEEAE